MCAISTQSARRGSVSYNLLQKLNPSFSTSGELGVPCPLAIFLPCESVESLQQEDCTTQRWGTRGQRRGWGNPCLHLAMRRDGDTYQGPPTLGILGSWPLWAAALSLGMAKGRGLFWETLSGVARWVWGVADK